MERIAPTTVRSQRGLLIDAIANVHTEFAHMKDELEAANREIAHLRSQLARKSPRRAPINEFDLPSLRRNVAFYCHPDRSGDGTLMRTLNVLFDYLEQLQHCPAGSR